MTLSIGGDHLLFDGLEAVTYYSVGEPTRSDGGIVSRPAPTAIAVASALKRMITEKDIVRYGRGGGGGEILDLRIGDVAWSLPIAQFGTTLEPKQGDYILEADGTRWEVFRQEKRTLETRWRVYARR